MISLRSPAVEAELARRLALWNSIKATNDLSHVPPRLLHEMGIYEGQRGIRVDIQFCGELGSDGAGVTISVMHTGKSYPDDLSDDSMIYHYPDTRIPGKDKSEIQATKDAARLGLPLFAVIYPRPNAKIRDVRLGWIEDTDDVSKTFFISFGEVRQQHISGLDVREEVSFSPTEPKSISRRAVDVRLGQTKFRYSVIRRYGPKCAVCSVHFQEALDAAHIVEKEERGSDDPRNGLVFCATHHREFDSGLFWIEPTTLRVFFKEDGPQASDLGIQFTDLRNLQAYPHNSALEMRWRKRSS